MLWIGICVGTVIGLLLATAGTALAGSLNPVVGPGGADSQMFTLEQIYQRLTSGAAGAKMTAFSEPAAGPGSGTMHTLDEIMAKAPALDASNGATTVNVTSGKTFWGLTAGQWGLQTGTAAASTYPAPVHKTGQTISLYAGDDGALQKGLAWPNPRFTDNGNGTVSDNLTGLIWLKNARCLGYMTWASALASANGLASGSCGLTDGSAAGDWRLPNINEMLSLVEYHDIALNPLPNGNPFSIIMSTYWTSTHYGTIRRVVSVDWNEGIEVTSNEYQTYYVWAVRGGQ